MTNTEKHLATALVVSATVVVLNIIAVTQSSGQSYYTVIEHFITQVLP